MGASAGGWGTIAENIPRRKYPIMEVRLPDMEVPWIDMEMFPYLEVVPNLRYMLKKR